MRLSQPNGVNTMFPIEVGTWHSSIGPWRARYGRELRGVGGMNKVGDATFDPDVFAAITREVKEEIFSKLVLSEIPEDPDELPTYIYEPIPVDLNFGPEDIVCSLSCHDRSGDGSHYKTFCFKKMPGDTPISAGKDQLQLELWTAQQIMRAIDAGESAFQRDHADAFKIAIEQGLVIIV